MANETTGSDLYTNDTPPAYAPPAVATPPALPEHVPPVTAPPATETPPPVDHAIVRTPENTPPPQETTMVPLPELIQTRQRAQQAEAQLEKATAALEQYGQLVQAQTPPQQPPPQQPADQVDVYDPEASFSSLQQQIATSERTTRIQTSRMIANGTHGVDVVNQAIEAAGSAGMDRAFAEQTDPIGAAVNWHKGQQVTAAFGTDIEAARAQMKKEILAELQPGGVNNGVAAIPLIPPTLAQTTDASGGTEVIGTNEDWFNQMMKE